MADVLESLVAQARGVVGAASPRLFTGFERAFVPGPQATEPEEVAPGVVIGPPLVQPTGLGWPQPDMLVSPVEEEEGVLPEPGPAPPLHMPAPAPPVVAEVLGPVARQGPAPAPLPAPSPAPARAPVGPELVPSSQPPGAEPQRTEAAPSSPPPLALSSSEPPVTVRPVPEPPAPAPVDQPQPMTPVPAASEPLEPLAVEAVVQRELRSVQTLLTEALPVPRQESPARDPRSAAPPLSASAAPGAPAPASVPEQAHLPSAGPALLPQPVPPAPVRVASGALDDLPAEALPVRVEPLPQPPDRPDQARDAEPSPSSPALPQAPESPAPEPVEPSRLVLTREETAPPPVAPAEPRLEPPPGEAEPARLELTSPALPPPQVDALPLATSQIEAQPEPRVVQVYVGRVVVRAPAPAARPAPAPRAASPRMSLHDYLAKRNRSGP